MSTSLPDSGASAAGVSLRKALVLISVVQLMLVLDATITNIALPHVARDLDLSQSALTWMVTAYALTFGGLLILGGRLGDMLGRRRTFTIGLVIFGTASLLGGFATEGWMLLFARGLQGVGAALASPAALALIATNFPAGPPRNKAMGVYAAMSGIGAAMGLLVGGWLTGIDSIFGLEVTGWRLTLLINAPIGFVAALLAPRWLAESARNRNPLDIPGALTGTLGMFALVYGLTKAGDADGGWTHPETIIFSLLGIALIVVFMVIEKRVEHPLLPLRIIKDRTRGTSFAAMLFASMAMMSMFYFNGQFVQRIVGYEPFKAGLAFLPFSMSVMVGTIVASQLVTRFSIRWITGAGTLFAAGGLFGFSFYTVDDSPAHAVARTLAGEGVGGDSFTYLADLFPFLALMGLGMGLVFVPMTLTAIHNIKDEDQGVGSSVLNTVTQIGGAFGLGLLSTVSLHFINDRSEAVTPEVRSLLEARGIDPDAVVPGAGQSMLDTVLFQTSFTEGATAAFMAAAGLMIVASIVMVSFMRVQPEELGQVRKRRGGEEEAAPETAAV
ncbi:MFS transporter [Nocardioides daphniae]|uniref:MFS transporter n=1 Tax=Nocardioides daphniae TaxID=402297 RepID=A0A4V1CWD0_9ACTN|nr:MFS transporter [Nocardioides daphniae]QCC76837.1 MFS transporter [Nocardioides daphniae]GGD17002.1 MFS transporter [Nocardioides daphniae]